jgi:threonine/homoserine/homoserine lactone efflux protein
MGLTLLSFHLAGRMRKHPLVAQLLQKAAAVVLLGFGLRLVLQK